MMAMILAAGRGERLKPLTDSIPKCLVKVGNETLLERHFQMLVRAGVTKVVINLGWLGEKIVDFVGSGEKFGLQVIYSLEDDEILETGGGIVKALPLLGDQPFWVINGDIYTDYIMPDIDLDSNSLGHLILIANPPYRSKGDFNLKDNKVIKDNILPYTFSGIALYDPKLFKNEVVRKFSIVPILFECIKNKRLSGSFFKGGWHDVGTPDRLARLNKLQD
jgi:MurNAc alpha-1-phosphate uridylyltransferase